MGKMSRDKGKDGERELARRLREYGYDAKRGVQYHGGADSPDVVGLPGIHIEVKRVEALRLYEALNQSINDAGKHELPAVFHRKNKSPWVVIMRLDDWMMLYEGQEHGHKRVHHADSKDGGTEHRHT